MKTENISVQSPTTQEMFFLFEKKSTSLNDVLALAFARKIICKKNYL